MFLKKNNSSHKGEEENPFLLSFSDLMASLLCIFILALIIFMIQLSKKKDELDREREKIKISLAELIGSLKEIQQTQDAIASALSGVSQRESSLAAVLEGIQRDLKEKGIEIIVAENGSVLRIPEQQLSFGLGRYEIPLSNIPVAETIGIALLHALNQPENRSLLDTVFIEGHTDSVPNSREMGNWGLSTYRAIALWNFWTSTSSSPCVELKTLKTIPQKEHDCPKPLISVSGYADTRPATSDELLSGKATLDRPKDRRIDIRFTLLASEKKSLEELHKRIEKMQGKTQGLIDKLNRSSNENSEPSIQSHK